MSLHALCFVLIRTSFSKSTSRPRMFRRFGITSASWNSLFYLKQTPLPSLTMALVSLFFPPSTLTQDNTATHNHCTREYGPIHSDSKRKLLPTATFMSTYCPLNESQEVFFFKGPKQKQHATCNHSLHYSLVAKTST